MSRTEQLRVWQQRCAFTSLRRVTGLGAIALMLSACSAAQHVSQGEPAIESNALREPQPFTRLSPATYTPEEWPQALTADVYLPDDSLGRLRPAALVVHGGGWRNRTPEDMQSIAESLAGQGYVAVNIEHRFAPEYRFPSQLHDLQQAMAWIHANADRWQVDTS
ncbi:alpha/beta hydrolase, partial [Halomonas sp. A3H3]